MSVDTRSQEYRDNQKRWQLVRDAIAGEEVIKKRGDSPLWNEINFNDVIIAAL